MSNPRAGGSNAVVPLLQRIMIFHLTLPERCLKGKSLGEGASFQEISEQVLYYHREESETSRMLDIKEVVQFLGLCTALLSLPSSLGGTSEDRTKAIYCASSTLVFVPLEDSQELVCAVQLSRLPPKSTAAEMGGGDPLAVQAAITRCHRLFCIFRGGGVLQRLTSKEARNESESVPGSPYPGMNLLYDLLKNLRRAQDGTARDDATTANVDMADLEERIKALRKTLPIQSIRNDLEEHYAEFLAFLAVVKSRNGGAFRSLVEAAPIPIPLENGEHAYQSSTGDSLSTFAAVELGLGIKSMLGTPFGETNAPALWGVSAFHTGRIIHTLLSRSLGEIVLLSSDDSNCNISLRKEDACLVMGHFAGLSRKLNQWSASTKSSSNHREQSNQFPWKDLAPSLDDKMKDVPGDYNVVPIPEPGEAGHFLCPPPTFMLPTTEDVEALVTGNGHNIWSPRLHIPFLLSDNRGKTKEVLVKTNVMVFEHAGFSFLLFGNPDSFAGASPDLVSAFSDSLGTKLNETVEMACDFDSPVNEPMVDELNDEDMTKRGQDILLINRREHRMVLYTKQRQVFLLKEGGKPSGKKMARKFLGFGSKSSNKKEAKSPSTMEWDALGLDCRHLLPSHLHLDTILAFDDMINEVATRRRMCTTTANSFEVCTCLPSVGWVCVLVDNEDELYILLDGSIYVTIADVQREVEQIRGRVLSCWEPPTGDALTT